MAQATPSRVEGCPWELLLLLPMGWLPVPLGMERRWRAGGRETGAGGGRLRTPSSHRTGNSTHSLTLRCAALC